LRAKESPLQSGSFNIENGEKYCIWKEWCLYDEKLCGRYRGFLNFIQNKHSIIAFVLATMHVMLIILVCQHAPIGMI
jgi:hypothetical protein